MYQDDRIWRDAVKVPSKRAKRVPSWTGGGQASGASAGGSAVSGTSSPVDKAGGGNFSRSGNTPERKSAPATHDLKTWPEFFNHLADGSKTFEVRLNDRDYQVGDALLLREFDPKEGTYSGRQAVRWVTYILAGENFTQALRPGYVIMGLSYD